MWMMCFLCLYQNNGMFVIKKEMNSRIRFLIVFKGDEQAYGVHGGCNEHPGCQCDGQGGLHEVLVRNRNT